MKILDISWPISKDTPEYEGRKTISIASSGDEYMIEMMNHTGTHVDGPRYFYKSAKSIDKFSLEQLMGSCTVLDLTSIKEKITNEDLEEHTIPVNSIILFKTKNSTLPATGKWHNEFIYLDPSGADFLASKKIKAVGIDYLALETNPDFPSHKILLKKEILIIEGLRLKEVKPGNYQIVCLPIKLIEIDAAWARAILIEK